MFDTHDAVCRRCVHELIATNDNPHMRCTGRDGAEEYEIPGLERRQVDGTPELILLLDLAGQRDTVLRKHVPYKPAAVETGRIFATVPIWCASKIQGG